MAHTCPTCGSTCMCNGDIDDCCFDFDEDVDACICCCDDDDLEDYYYDDPDFNDWEEEEAEQPVEPSVKLGCSCARPSGEFHGWRCTVSGDSCVFLIPSSEACAKEVADFDRRFGLSPTPEHVCLTP